MTEAAEATMVSVALAGLRQFEEWQDFAPEALNLATAYPSDFGLRDQVAGIAKRFGKQEAVLRFWEEAARPKFKVVAKPQVEVGPKPFKRRKLALAGALRRDAERMNAALASQDAATTKKISPEPQPAAAEADGSTIAAAATEAKAEAEPETKGGLPMVLAPPKIPVAWDDVIEAMNRRHPIIDNVGGKTVIAGWEPSQLNPERMVVVFQQKESFLLRYSNRTATIDVPDGRGGSRQSAEALGQWWLRHRHRRQHRGITFLPGGPEIVNECLNLWQGWGVEPKPGNWSLIR
jgi:hypothetical protein